MLVSGMFFLLILSMMVTPCIYIIHMFQQNRYELDRYMSWFKANIKIVIKHNITTIVVSIMLIIVRFFAYYEVLSIWIISSKIVVDYYLAQKEQKIKPLKYTFRVQRQIIIIIILNVIWLLPSLIYIPNEYLIIVLLVSLWINQGLIPLAIWLIKPLELFFHRRFMKQAKEILKSYSQLKVIGITGSYGKTSSKNVIQEILSAKYYSLMTPESFNTPMGITLTIKNKLKAIHEVFICEMGADHVGDIEELMSFVEPHFGIVTSIGPQHLSTFMTQENIIVEKMKAIEMLPSGGCGILNMDNEYISEYDIKNKEITLIKVGIDSSDVDYQAININYNNNGSSFDIKSKEGINHYETVLLGKHNINNILVAVALAKQLGIEDEVIVKAVKRCSFISHRLELKTINGLRFVDNAFNSNPSGSKMSLDVLAKMPGNRYIVTPGMIDLGDKQDQYNYEFGLYMIDKADHCILVGENQTKHIYRGLQDAGFDMNKVEVVDKVLEAFNIVYSKATKEDTILLENDLPDAFNN